MTAARKMAAAPISSSPNHQGVAIIAIAALALFTSTPSIHAFSSGTSRRYSTQLSARGAKLQPGKGGIVVEAKSDFVARDVLCDEFMGRSGDGEGGGGGESQAQSEELDGSQPNEQGWLSSSSSFSSAANTKRQPYGNIGQQQSKQSSQPKPRKQPPQPRQQQVPKQQQPQAPPDNVSNGAPRASAAEQAIFSSSRQQQQVPMPPQSPPPPSTRKQSKLPDPSLMKLTDIQGELSLRRVSSEGCFDRISLEDKLLEAREAMAAAGSMDRGSRRNASTNANTGNGGATVGGGNVVGGSDIGGQRGPDASSNVMSGVMPPFVPRPTSSAPRASAAEQNIFSQSTRGARTNNAQSAGRRQAPPAATAAASGNPFSRTNTNRVAGLRKGGNSSSSFRDNAHGIGFGDANSYASGNIGGDMNANAGGSGAGVSLGKQKTSYGDFNGGSSIGFGTDSRSYGSSGGGVSSGGGGSSAPQPAAPPRPPAAPRQAAPRPAAAPRPPAATVGGGTASFKSGGGVSGGGGTSTFSSGGGRGGGVSGGGGTNTFSSGGMSGGGGGSTSFKAGGVSIKGDSSMFSSMGSVGGQGAGSTVVFNSGGGTGPSGGMGTRAPPRPPPSNNVRPPAPPAEEPELLDWLVQDSPSSDSYENLDLTATTSYGGSYDDEPIYDNAPQYIDDNTDNASEYTNPYPGKSLSQQYQDQGLDMLSGGQPGFGAMQGEAKNEGGGGGGGGAGFGGGGNGAIGGDFGGNDRGSAGGYGGGGGGGAAAGVVGGTVGGGFAPRRGGARTSEGGDADYFEDMEDECV